jgi:hypothetical protein
LTVCSSGARLTAGVMMSGMIFQLFCLVGWESGVNLNLEVSEEQHQSRRRVRVSLLWGLRGSQQHRQRQCPEVNLLKSFWNLMGTSAMSRPWPMRTC